MADNSYDCTWEYDLPKGEIKNIIDKDRRSGLIIKIVCFGILIFGVLVSGVIMLGGKSLNEDNNLSEYLKSKIVFFKVEDYSVQIKNFSADASFYLIKEKDDYSILIEGKNITERDIRELISILSNK